MKRMKTNIFSEYNVEALMDIIETQKKISEYQKKNNHKSLYQVLIVIDDFADHEKMQAFKVIKPVIY